MLKITKTKPEFFKKLIKGKKVWSDIKNREELNQNLVKEQEGMCAYCESRLKDYHIDHFFKRDLFPKLTFDYDNLFLSCNCERNCAKFKDRFGLKKEEFFNIFSPIDINLDEFDYSLTGEILGKTAKAKRTIEVFNLNSKSLVEKRKRISYQTMGLEFDLFEIFGEFKTFLKVLEGIK
ncbi:MAG: TIGR02646 family protein [Epsilonproteobacteria bacterium]|nr:TIGR02646 family protein [Campylobacterota bacterium]